ncbi:hypothetical protein [Burkholderia ambifaria]|uniref:hypothetical protein n=1 Tax=Burkholderia ambifaria TaxID=152480 RepID=UPI001589A669|nr:hypothetical protein [Burkholderia ambifaria]
MIFVEFDGNKVSSGLTPGFPIQGFSASGVFIQQRSLTEMDVSASRSARRQGSSINATPPAWRRPVRRKHRACFMLVIGLFDRR